MSVLFDARYPAETGVGRYVTALERELRLRGTLAYRFVRSDRRGPDDVVLPTRPFHIADQLALAWGLGRARPRLFHRPHFLAPLLWSGAVILTIHDVIPLEYPNSIAGGFARRIYPRLLRLSCARASLILVPSRATGDALVRHGLATQDRIVVTPPGPPSVPTCDGDEPVAERASILFIGDLKPHKNVGTLIRAYGGLTSEVRNRAPLVIVGDGPEMPALREQACALGLAADVRFLDHVDEERLPGLYAAARLLVVPSFVEGFGFPALDAMTRGIPVAISDVPALRETTGGAAAIFNPNDPGELRSLLISLLEDDQACANLQTLGRERARAFSWSTTARLTEGAYRRALAEQ